MDTLPLDATLEEIIAGIESGEKTAGMYVMLLAICRSLHRLEGNFVKMEASLDPDEMGEDNDPYLLGLEGR